MNIVSVYQLFSTQVTLIKGNNVASFATQKHRRESIDGSFITVNRFFFLKTRSLDRCGRWLRTNHPISIHTFSGRISSVFFYFRKILPLAILWLSPFSFLSLLLSCFTLTPPLTSQLIFLSHTLDFLLRNLRSLLPRTSLSLPRHLLRTAYFSLSVQRIGEHFSHTNYYFASYFASGDAPLAARHPRCICSCMQLLRSCNLRPRRTTRFGPRYSAKCYSGFLFPPPCHRIPFNLAIVPRECFARLRFSRAWLSGMHPVSRSVVDRRLSWYFCLRWKVMLFEAFVFFFRDRLLVL